MKEKFTYCMPTRVCFEAGISKKVAQFIKGDNVLIISDPFLFNNGVAKAIGDSMADKNVAYFSDIEPNPSCESVDAAAKVARDIKADCVIGLGGGSSLDVSKIVSSSCTEIAGSKEISDNRTLASSSKSGSSKSNRFNKYFVSSLQGPNRQAIAYSSVCCFR